MTIRRCKVRKTPPHPLVRQTQLTVPDLFRKEADGL
jgi:hypothetical protein